MKFWMYLFRILMILSIPRKIETLYYEGHNLIIIHNCIMPWAKGFTIGTDIYINGKPKHTERALIHHEYIHTLQWKELGWKFPFLYYWSGLKAFAKGKRMYYDNAFEVEAYTQEYKFCKENNLPYVDKYRDVK